MASGTPSKTLSRPFSAFLICSQLATTASASWASTSPNTCGCRRDELVVHRRGDVGGGELPGLGGELGVEQHLEEQVAQLLLEVLVALAARARRGGRWPRGPRSSPRAGGGAASWWVCSWSHGHSARSTATSSTKRASSRATGAARSGRYTRGEVVGLDPVELGPRDALDPLVGQAEALEHHDLGVVGHARVDAGVEGELHVGEHVGAVALGDEQRTTLPRRLDGEAVAVDDPHADGDGVDAEAHPGQVEERQRRQHLDLDPVVGEEQLDGVLGHQGRAGHGVEHARRARRRRPPGARRSPGRPRRSSRRAS